MALFLEASVSAFRFTCTRKFSCKRVYSGTFTALNFFHWFIFWELSRSRVLPRALVACSAPAATQFFIYTMVGSVAMLLVPSRFSLRRASFFIELAELAATAHWLPRSLPNSVGII
jgi:NADH-quinone oxidoreductase subunit M